LQGFAALVEQDALDGNAPIPQDIEPPEKGQVFSIPQVGGLHHRYKRRAAWRPRRFPAFAVSFDATSLRAMLTHVVPMAISLTSLPTASPCRHLKILWHWTNAVTPNCTSNQRHPTLPSNMTFSGGIGVATSVFSGRSRCRLANWTAWT
jgi:hypothetical protein